MKDAQKPADQRPEDFMDEEDLREAEESRTLNTSQEFAGFGTQDDSMRRTAEIDIFRSEEDTVGSRLLRRMGWKEGQGIGPRVRRAANLGDERDEPADMHLFAPDDVRIIFFARKTDRKGIGYDGELQEAKDPSRPRQDLTQRPAISGEPSEDEEIGPLLGSTRKPAPRKKAKGFGVGILNDDGSDDDDPYSMGPKISYNKALGGDKKSKTKQKNTGSSANPLLKTKPTFISKRWANLKGSLRKCHDGQLPPDGFILADQLDSLGSLTIQDDKYRPPDVPSSWTSSISKETREESDSTFISTADAARASTLTAKSRSMLLGETQLPGKSVFDFLTSTARDRLAVASGQQNLPRAGGEAPPPGYKASSSTAQPEQSPVPQLDREVALQALNRGVGGWMPYAEDDNKRTRYQRYLEIQAGLGADELPLRAENMSKEDWMIELREFARAAEVFKPISGLMASRFTSSSSVPQRQSESSSAVSADSLLTRPSEKPQDPGESAAKMGMFGPMTRSISNFYPTRLLCKRFNVPMPTHAAHEAHGEKDGKAMPGGQASKAAEQFRSFQSAGFEVENMSKTSERREDSHHGQKLPKREGGQNSAPAGMGMDPDRNEALEQERPGQAVFKAIFGSDDEDE